ncbi:hypothetical protein JCM11491_005697 [Sporobolomyces phaffii]
MSHYRPFASSPSESTHGPPPALAAAAPTPSSRRPSKEDRSVKERIDVLVERLDRAKDILLVDCARGDRFGVLALGTLERNLKELVPVIKLIEQSRSIPSVETRERKGEPELDDSRSNNQRRDHNGTSTDLFAIPTGRAGQEDFDRGDARRSQMAAVDEHPSSRRSAVASPEPLSPASRPLPISRPASTRSSDVTQPRRDGARSSARDSVSEFFDRAKETVSPKVSQLDDPRLNFSFDTPIKRAPGLQSREEEDRLPEQAPYTNDASRSGLPRAQHTSSSDHKVASRREDEGEQHRSRSRAGRSSSRAGRSVETRKALDLASAPPESSDDDIGRRDRRHARVSREKRVVRLDGRRVIETIAHESDQAGKARLVAVSRGYRSVVEPLLYSTITIKSVPQAMRLVETLEAKPRLAELTTSLVIVPLDSNSSRSGPSILIAPVRRLVALLPNLAQFDEDFTKSDWDVTKISPASTEYPLLSDGPSTALESFTSKRCWWEIGAIHDLFVSQPRLAHVVFGGAAMDRDWEGSKLKASLQSSSSSRDRNPSRVESLTVAQVMHEETLSVLLHLSANPRFRSLSVSFQSIGPSDDDTPLSSIPLAIKLVSASLTHLTVVAPATASSFRVTEDTSTLLEDVLALVPHLTHLSFQETPPSSANGGGLAVPIVTAHALTRRVLPSGLKVLRARRVFSVSNRDVLSMLDDPEAISVLEELDFEWAATISDDAAGKHGWNEREADEIRRACEQYGIVCDVSQGERKLSLA